MSYIKFVLSKRLVTGDAKRPYVAVISRLESDMADAALLETNIIFHALSADGGRVEETRDFILDAGVLDADLLG